MKKEMKVKKEINTTLPVYDLKGEVVDNIQLDKDYFDGKVNKVLLYEIEKMYEANVRRGTASTKRRGEVAGGGSKPWRQKGTGRARAGSIRSPLWRHGGSIFGPKPRNFYYTMPKKAMQRALQSSLNARFTENLIKAIVKIELKQPKTKEFNKILNNLKLDGKTLVIVKDVTDSVKRSSNNIQGVTLRDPMNINVRDVLLNKNIVIEKDAFKKIVERLK